jgi:predicted transposase YdaD
MPKPFDAATKFLVEAFPEDWVRFFGLPGGDVRVIDTDISTVSAAADRGLLVETDFSTYGIQVEFQGNIDPNFEPRLLQYRTALRLRWSVPFTSIAVLLRPFTGHNLLRGRYLEPGLDDKIEISFRYRVIRIWQIPTEEFLDGPLATLPFAPVARTSRRDLPRVIRRLEERLSREATPSDADFLRTATHVLLGLRYSRDFVENLMSSNVLELSSTYQGILSDGAIRATKDLIFRLGRKRLGELSSAQLEQVEALQDKERLEALAERLLEAETWQELLGS